MGVGSAGLTAGSDWALGNLYVTYDDQGNRNGVVIGQDTIAATRNMVAGAIAPEIHLDFAINASQFAYDIERLTGRREAKPVEIEFSDPASSTKDVLKATLYECAWIGLCQD